MSVIIADDAPAVLITGAARRVGAALARGFAAKGYQLAIHYNHSKQEAEALASVLNAKLFQANLTETNAAHDLIAHVTKSLPNLAVLINNASTFHRAHLADSTEQSLQADMAINLHAPLNLMREFQQQVGQGSIINLLDTAISGYHPAYFGYLLAKKSLAEATKMAAREFAPDIRVNGLCLGHILPTENGGQFDPKNRVSKNPAKRLAMLSEVVEAALMLAQSKAYHGQLFNIDAGESLL